MKKVCSRLIAALTSCRACSRSKKRASSLSARSIAAFAAILVKCIAVTSVFVGCDSRQNHASTPEAVALMESVSEQKDNDRTLMVADSLEKAGVLSKGVSCFWQGYAYNMKRQRQVAQYYWEEAMKATVNSTDPTDLAYYAKAASYLTGIYLRNSEFSIALQTAMPAVSRLEQLHCDSTSDYINLLVFSGCCRAHFDHNDPTSQELFEQAYQKHLDNIRQKGNKDAYHDVVVGLINISYGMSVEGMYEEGLVWTERMGQSVAEYKARFPDDEKYIDKQWARYKIYHAIVLEGLGRHEEAAREYDEFRQTSFSQTLDGLNNAAYYLTVAKRWQEAAECYNAASYYFSVDSIMFSLDLVQNYMLKKFKSNMMTGLIDSANVVARSICENLDSAIQHTRTTEAIGLETIRQKNTEIAEQEMKTAEWQKRTAFLILGISLLIFIAYTIYRHRVQQRLAKAHHELKVAYDQLEETTTTKERIESELRIARDIQMSMVPNQFPEYEGLDMYASMTPAKEVGGDLYGYHLEGDKLYFALGDVSGKGVPASLFMAQATRLFLTHATQGMMPAEICTSINNALAGKDNVNAMFVTMFIGLLDLKTGHLDFCNAGHNAPVIQSDKREVISDKRSDNHSSLITYHFLDMLPNAPIGLWPGLEYEGEELDSIKGRLLFIYTDGLNEAENRQQEQFGEDRLLEILRAIHYENARQVIETIEAEVEKHRDGAEPNDDLTMMCIKL